MGKENETRGEKPRKIKVLVAIDGSKISELVVKRSGQYAKATDCDVTILYVIQHALTHDIFPAGKAILEKAEKTLKHYGVACKTELVAGSTAAEIVRVAEKGEFDVIFVGSRGYGGIKRMLLGSVADNVIRHAHCSVAVIR